MQIVDFYALDRSTQDRFIASSHGREVPRPLLFTPPRLNAWTQRLGAATMLLIALLFAFAWLGYGRLGHPWAQNRVWAIAVYAALCATTAGTAFFAWKFWDNDNSLPFLRGVFLYPIGVIDARSASVVVHELTTMTDLRLESGALKLAFLSGAKFEFVLPDPARGDAIVSTLTESQSRVSLPPGVHSQRDHVLQNPLLDTGFKNPFGPTEALKPRVLRNTALWATLAVMLGLALGAGVYPLRNNLSARSLYAKARQLDSTDAYRSFLASGAKQPDVTEILLPRAELRDAVAKKSADAIEAFLDGHPRSKIEAEALLALRQALLIELEAAKAKKTLTALRQFRKGDPRTLLVEAERVKAETDVYRTALSRFQEVSVEQPAHVDFVARLLEYTRKRGEAVDVRFRRRQSDSVERTESQVKKSAYYIGPPALPAQYFDAARSLPRETKTATALIDRFATVFPSDVLSFQLAEPLADDGTDLPKLERPTLLVTYRLDMSGPFTSNKPRGAFCGISLAFKASFIIPGDDKPLVFQQSSWTPPNLRKVEEERIALPDMYEAMAQEAFNRFVNKYQASLLKPQTK